MPTTTDYLQDLKAQQTALAANLTAQGVTAAATEKLNTLVPKVLLISSDNHRASGTFTPAADTALFSVNNLAFLPKRAAIYCGDAFIGTAPTSGNAHHGVVSIDRNRTICLALMYRTVDNTLNGFGTSGSTAFSAVTLSQGTFAVSNMRHNNLPLYFAAGKTYFWFACDNT